MAKYSFELKLKVVKAYLEGEGGYKYLAKKYEIKDWSNIRLWRKAYLEFGEVECQQFFRQKLREMLMSVSYWSFIT